MANKKKLRESYRRRFHDKVEMTEVKASLDGKHNNSKFDDVPSEMIRQNLRADEPLKERIDDRQDFKGKDKQNPKKKFQVVKRYQKQDESIRRKALKQKSKKKNAYMDKKFRQSNHEKNTLTQDDLKSSRSSDVKTNVSKTSKASTKSAKVIDLRKETDFSKPKDKTKKNKLEQKDKKPEKQKGLKENRSSKSKLNHVAKDVTYSAHFLSRKMDQFESQKESDENSAMMAADEGGQIIGRTLHNKTSKRRSKLKFDKAVREKVPDAKDSPKYIRSRFKNSNLKQSKINQKKNIKKTYNANKRLNYGGIKGRFKNLLKKVKEWAIKGLKKMGIYMIGPAFVFIISAVMLFSLLQSFSSGVSGIASTSYQSDDVEITNSHLIYTGLEADLKYAIENVESDHSGYDEYKYSIDAIGHDMHLLMAYLTAKYEDFTSSEVRSELNSIFNEQYDYRLTEVIEVRYKTVHHSSTDPETGETSSWTTQEPYNWYILKVSLDTNDLENILLSNLDEDEKEFYEALVETKGNFTNLPNPFDEPWANAVSSYFGYRLDPISKQVTFHAGIDIAKPTGTELLSIIEGTVSKVAYDANGYGHYIIVENDKGESILYGHCSSIKTNLGDEVEAGDVIALVGSTGKSTGAHVHLEVRDSEGNKLNPYFYLSQE